MGIETTTADLIASGFGVGHFTQTRQQRTDQHDRTTQFIAFLEKIGTAQVGGVKFAGRKGVCTFGEFLHTHADGRKHVDEVIDIEDIRQVVDDYRFLGEQHGAKHL